VQPVIEAIAQAIDRVAEGEPDERRGRDVERDLARLDIQVDLAALDPVGRPAPDDLGHDREVAGHVGGGERRVHELPVPFPLVAVHIQEPAPEERPEHWRPALVVREMTAMGVQDQAICLGPDEIDDSRRPARQRLIEVALEDRTMGGGHLPRIRGNPRCSSSNPVVSVGSSPIERAMAVLPEAVMPFRGLPDRHQG